MKKLIASIILIAVVITAVAVFTTGKQTQSADYLRIHIRADSNDECDQQIKYKVKDAVVEYLTPLLSGVGDKQQAMTIVENNLENIRLVADRSLQVQGAAYSSTVKLTQEEFPVRTYGELTLDSGVYDALIIELGSGEGDNWWCVVFPPLCFVADQSNPQYKSLIVDAIKKLKGWLS
ncbi:MAG: stage II sporulation protein R [Christensenellales bacterium]